MPSPKGAEPRSGGVEARRSRAEKKLGAVHFCRPHVLAGLPRLSVGVHVVVIGVGFQAAVKAFFCCVQLGQ